MAEVIYGSLLVFAGVLVWSARFISLAVYLHWALHKWRGSLGVFWGSSGQDKYRWDLKKEKKREEMKNKSKFVAREETRRRRIVKNELKRCQQEDAITRPRRERYKKIGLSQWFNSGFFGNGGEENISVLQSHFKSSPEKAKTEYAKLGLNMEVNMVEGSLSKRRVRAKVADILSTRSAGPNSSPSAPTGP